MPRRVVELRAGEYYHLFNRGNNREPIFLERNNYLFFLQRIHQYLVPVLDVLAYCLMPTHYHLLVLIKGQPQTSEVSETSEVSPVSGAMMRFSVSYTKAMNKRYDRVGSVFQGAFQAKRVDSDAYLMHLSRYVHLNPVLARCGTVPEEWEFSSYPEYIGLREGTLPKPEVVLSRFPSREAYREFVESYAPADQRTVKHLLFD
jgi:putative transposase